VPRRLPEAAASSWDSAGAQCIALDGRWNEATEPRGDVATDRDVSPVLPALLAVELQRNTRSAVFVFGHEPACPLHRHVDNSLNEDEDNRDAYRALLEREPVVASICGHTHVHSSYRHDGGRVWPRLAN
jgi:hypothetical protein